MKVLTAMFQFQMFAGKMDEIINSHTQNQEWKGGWGGYLSLHTTQEAVSLPHFQRTHENQGVLQHLQPKSDSRAP